MQPIADAIQGKIIKGEKVTLAEHAVLHLHNETKLLNAKLDAILDQQKAFSERQEAIFKTFEQGSGALKVFKITSIIVAPFAALYGLFHALFGATPK